MSFVTAQLIYRVKTKHSALHNLTWPPQESALTLRHLWAAGYQVILSYDSQCAVGHKELWPAIPYWWANQRTAQGVTDYLDYKKHLGRPGWVSVTLSAHVFPVTLVLSRNEAFLVVLFFFFPRELLCLWFEPDG